MIRAQIFLFGLLFAFVHPVYIDILLLGEEHLVTPDTNEIGQLHASAAAGTDLFFVVWEQGVGTRSRIYAARLDLKGRSIDPLGIQISHGNGGQFEPAVAFGHGTFLVVYSDLSGDSHRVVSRKFSGNGTALDGDPIPLSARGAIARMPAVATTPEGFAVVWAQAANGGRDFELWGRRLDTKARPITTPQKLVGAPSRSAPQNFLNNNNLLSIVQNPKLAVHENQALVVWAGTLGKGRRYSIGGVRWNLKTGRLSSSPKILVKGSPRVLHPVLCTFSDGFLLSWTDRLSRGFHGPAGGNLALVTGEQVRLIPLTEKGGTREILAPALSSNGLLAFITQGKKARSGLFKHNPLYLKQIEPDDMRGGIEWIVSPDAAWPVLASNESGNTLLVYTRINSTERNGMLAARTIQLP